MSITFNKTEKKETINAVIDVEQRKLLCTADGFVKW